VVKKQVQARIGVVIQTPEGMLIPSAETLRKMKNAQAQGAKVKKAKVKKRK